MPSFTKTRYIPCDKCRGKLGPKGQPGFYYNKDRTVTECSCHKQWVANNLLMVKAKKADIWMSETALLYDPMKDYYGDISRPEMERLVDYCDAYGTDERLIRQSIYITGREFSQKTYLAKWLGLQMLKKGYEVAYLRMSNFLQAITKTFENREAQEKEINRLRKIDILIIDDFCKKNSTAVYDYQQPNIEDFLRSRIEGEQKGVVFVSRVAPEDIRASGFNPSLQEYVLRNTRLQNAVFTFNDVYGADFDLKKAIRKHNGN